jgi:excinuclease ABC subunit A
VGEAQRIKLAAELTRASDGRRSVVVLDEPTTGLARSDVAQLYAVLRRLVERGDAVLVIEHHLELLAACDWLIELGPGGGAAGGRVIAQGTPAELARDEASVTGPWLARAETALAARPPRTAARTRRREALA